MKKFFIIVLFSLLHMGVKAATAEALVVKFKDNTTVQFILNESPKIQFVSDSLVINSTTLTGKYAYDAIRNLHFEAVEITSINSAKTEENTLRVILSSRNEYTIGGLKNNDKVLIYSTSGQLLSTVKPTNGSAKVSLQNLTDGNYIIKVAGKHAFKVLKK